MHVPVRQGDDSQVSKQTDETIGFGMIGHASLNDIGEADRRQCVRIGAQCDALSRDSFCVSAARALGQPVQSNLP
jgi:hypothetical protein